MGKPLDAKAEVERRENGSPPPESSSPLPPPSSPSASTSAELVAELRLIRHELAGLREELRAAARPPAATGPATEAPQGRRAFPLPAAVERMPTRLRVISTDARATLAGWRGGPEWAPPRALVWDIGALLVIGLAAWLLRYVDIAGIPPGLHGDEAATGLEARRILDDGWIGVYTGVAGGNPTGAYYLAAIPISLVSDPVVAVRLLSVIFGTVAVVALYVLIRRNLGFGSAIVGATVLAFCEWHIQFSRTGFVTGLWPTFVLLGVIALMEALRTASWRWWAAAGALLSSGVYIYNGHAPFMLVLALFVGWSLFGWTAVAAAVCVAVATTATWPVALGLAVVAIALLIVTPRLRERQRLINAGAFVLASLVVLRGMINFARAHRQDYFGRSERLSVFRTEEWTTTSGLVDQVRFVVGRYREFWDLLTFDPEPNGVDLSGVTPIVPELTLYLCLAGLLIALVRRPSPLVWLATLVVLATPLTAVLTDLTLRRALVIAPFLALLAGVGVTEVARLAFRRGRTTGVVAGLVLLGLLGISCYRNVTDFFDETVDSGPVQHTFATDLREAASYIDSLPDDAYLYFYADRWVLEYDVVQLIAPDIVGEDRSPVRGGTGTLEVDRSKGTPVFLLMGAYTAELDRLQAMYPGGEVVVGKTLPLPLNGPSYVAYLLPPPSA